MNSKLYKEQKICNLWSQKTYCISQTLGYPSCCKSILQSHCLHSLVLHKLSLNTELPFYSKMRKLLMIKHPFDKAVI